MVDAEEVRGIVSVLCTLDGYTGSMRASASIRKRISNRRPIRIYVAVAVSLVHDPVVYTI